MNGSTPLPFNPPSPIQYKIWESARGLYKTLTRRAWEVGGLLCRIVLLSFSVLYLYNIFKFHVVSLWCVLYYQFQNNGCCCSWQNKMLLLVTATESWTMLVAGIVRGGINFGSVTSNNSCLGHEQQPLATSPATTTGSVTTNNNSWYICLTLFVY